MRVELKLLVGLAAALVLACQDESASPEAPQIPKEKVEARATVDRAVATTGDLLTYSVIVDHQDGIELEMPEIASEIAGFRIVDLGRDEPETRDDRVIQRQWYELRADLVGSYVLPPIEIRWRPANQPEGEFQAIATSELFIEVASVLKDGEEATDIRELKGLRPKAQPKIWPWALGGVGLLAVVIAALLYWRRRRARRYVPPRPAHEIAFEALDLLRTTDFEDKEAVRLYYFSLSEVVRTYVEGRWGLNATDLTTEEIFGALEQGAPMLESHQEKLRRFLLDTDRVKFAAHEASADEIRGAYEDALSFVESTRPTLQEDELNAETSQEIEEIAA